MLISRMLSELLRAGGVMKRVRRRLATILAAAVVIQLCCASGARAQSAMAVTPADERAAEKMPDQAKSLTEVNKELSNPISSIWSLTFQENTYWLTAPAGHSERNNINLQFQPVLPIGLTEDWNLINRPVFQVLNSTPYINKSGNLHRVTGFGDTIFATMLSPTSKLTGNWLLAAGPSFIFPIASNSRLGQNKWQLGAAGVIGYMGEKFLVGIFPQQEPKDGLQTAG